MANDECVSSPHMENNIIGSVVQSVPAHAMALPYYPHETMLYMRLKILCKLNGLDCRGKQPFRYLARVLHHVHKFLEVYEPIPILVNLAQGLLHDLLTHFVLKPAAV